MNQALNISSFVIAGGTMVIVGIDFGTTRSTVAHASGGIIEVIETEQTERSIPSCVAFTKVERLVGEAAVYQSAKNSKNTIFAVKRMLGCKSGEEHAIFSHHKNIKTAAFYDTSQIQVEYKGEESKFYSEEIAAMILSRLKEIVYDRLKQRVTGAMITVPDSFNAVKRRATIQAAKIAGIPLVGLINETVAAAISYGLKNEVKSKRTVMVFHLGGGAFDVSLLTMEDSKCHVVATAGSPKLGGEDFTEHLLTYCIGHIKKKTDTDINITPRAVCRLREACEKAKRDLNSENQVSIKVDGLFSGDDFEHKITQAEFKAINSDLLDRMRCYVNRMFKYANHTKQKVDDIIAVGGATRLPMVQDLIAEFGKEKIRKNINKNEAPALGAAAQAAMLHGGWDDNEFHIQELLSHKILVSFQDVTKVIWKRGTPIPNRKWHEIDSTLNTTLISTFSILCEDDDGVRTEFGRYDNVIGKQTKLASILFEISPSGLPIVTTYYDNGEMELKDASSMFEEEKLQKLRQSADDYQLEDTKRKAILNNLHKIEKDAYKLRGSIHRKNISHKTKKEASKKCDDIIKHIGDITNPQAKDVDEMGKKLRSVRGESSDETAERSIHTPPFPHVDEHVIDSPHRDSEKHAEPEDFFRKKDNALEEPNPSKRGDEKRSRPKMNGTCIIL